MRVAFFGTPAFAVSTLTALAGSSHELVGVITQPDRPRGRGQRVTPAPVKVASLALGVPVLQPERLKDEGFLAAFDALDTDLAVVAAYGKMLPQILLDRPRLGMLNVHASLLPRWRGAAPIHRAILAGDRETGITIMRVVLALDAGPMLGRTVLPIDPNETSADLEARLATAGAALLITTISALATGATHEEVQDESLVTYARRLERADSQIDWTRPSGVVHDQIRGLHPWPLAAALLTGQRVRLIRSLVPGNPVQAGARPGVILSVDPDFLTVATGDGTLQLTRLQPEGRPTMSVRDFVNGRRVVAGERFEPLPPP